MQGGLQWPNWGMYVESKGKQGEKCDMEAACKLLDYVKEWETRDRRGRPPQGMGEDPADQCRRGVLDRHRERHPPAGRGRPQGAQRAQGGLLRLGSRRLYRPLPARHVLGRAVRKACPGQDLASVAAPPLRQPIDNHHLHTGLPRARAVPISRHSLPFRLRRRPSDAILVLGGWELLSLGNANARHWNSDCCPHWHPAGDRR